jgi:hypothetical protein
MSVEENVNKAKDHFFFKSYAAKRDHMSDKDKICRLADKRRGDEAKVNLHAKNQINLSKIP